MLTYEQFQMVEMRVGRIDRVEDFPEARRPAYKLWIDFGDFGVRRSSAQITVRYRPEELVGRLVVAVTNFPPNQIANFLSEVLVLGASDPDGAIVLLHPDASVPLGARIH
jgi:tRNA-binding protein